MQIFTMCMECQKELGHPSFEPFVVPYFDDRIAYVKCSRGHKSAVLVQSQKFEVLLESGANALIAGFTLEAVSSFSAALERFYEFCVEVIAIHRKMPREVYEQMFKTMARQSERQMGAFLALHAVELGVAYIPDPKITEFRNAIIHKGQIPSPDQSHEFCSKVYDEILRLFKMLSKNFSTAIQEQVSHDVKVRWERVSKEMPTATASGTMFFNLTHAEHKETFKEALDQYVKTEHFQKDAVAPLRVFYQALMQALQQDHE